ncbi:MAG: hypothetical protein P8Y09_01825, partial [Deltaproteobacteria bacterium]
FDYRKGLEGEVKLHIFPLLPLHDEGMERNIYPLLWIYRYTRSPEGDTFSDVLWGLYRRRTTSRSSSTQFAFFLRIDKRREGTLALSFLEGLLRYYHDAQEGGKVGFFFMDPSD